MGIQEKTARRTSSLVSRVRKAGAETCFQNPESAVEILIEGEECHFCCFARLRRDGSEIICPVCGYGHKPST